MVDASAANLEPLVAGYLGELAAAFHAWYNACPSWSRDTTLRDARLALASATRGAINGHLDLMGVSAPESM